MTSSRSALVRLIVAAVVLVGLGAPSVASAYSTSRTQTMYYTGQNMIFVFTGLPVATGNVSVKVDLYGDYEATNEYAEIWVDNIKQANHTGGSPTCNKTAHAKTYSVASSYVADTVLTVRVDNSATVNTNCNPRRVVVTVSYASTPDLRFITTTVPATGSTGAVGSTFTANYTVRADHEPVTTAFDVLFYWCTSSSASSCGQIGTQTITTAFKAGQSIAFKSPTLTVPSYARYGYGYVRTFIDAKNAIKELNESNNTDMDLVQVTARPDLTVTAGKVPASGTTTGPGATFTGSYTINNAPKTSGFTTNFYMRYYYCIAQSTGGCTYLGQQQITKDMKSGDSYSFTSPKLTLPSNATPGTRYIRAHVDGYGYSYGYVREANESNNNRYDAITLTQGGPGDLKVTAASVPYGGSTAGSGSVFTARYTINNAGTGVITSNFYNRFYYCPAQSTSNCVYLGYQYISTNFAPGASHSFTSGNLSMPSSVAYGVGYIRIQVDYTNRVKESNEANNNFYDPISVTKRPDLYFSSSTVPFTGSTASPGSTFTGRYTIRNLSGTSALSTDFNISYYFCPAASTTGCTLLATHKYTNNFSAGTYYSFTSPTLTVPSSAKVGTAYIMAYADSTGLVTEGNELNNRDYDPITVGGSGSVDLIIQSNSVVPNSGSTAGAGSTFTARYNVKNTGKGTVVNDFYTYFYYCPYSSTSSCRYLGNQLITTNFAGGQATWFTSPTLTLPSSVTYGTRYVRMYVDATNTVSETSGTNNTRYDAITVSTRPDLSFSSGTVPYSGNTNGPGSKFTARYTLQNGAKTSYFSTNFYVRYYYCPTKSATGCTYLSYNYIYTNFNAGTSASFTSPTLTLPSSVKNGVGYIRAVADAGKAVTESNENNNDLYSAIAIGSSDPDLRVDSTTVPFGGTTNGSGSTFSARYRVVNAGTGAVNQAFAVAFYYCPGASTTGCTSLGTQAITTKLAGGASLFVTSPTLTLPDTVVYGTRYVRIYVDSTMGIKESNENNNNTWDSISVTSRPDLYVLASSVPHSGDTTGPGSKFNGQYTVRNSSGTSATSKAFQVRYYYCTTVSTSTCTYLGGQQISSALKAGQSHSYTSITLALPASATKGAAYVRAFVDATNSISEYNEYNNNDWDPITVGAALPDMYVKELIITSKGTEVSYKVTACNKGGTSKTYTLLSVYFSLPNAPACNYKRDLYQSIVPLAKGACASHTFVRKGAPPGAYVGWAMTDSVCKLAEADETNNTAKAAYMVTKPTPDVGVPDMVLADAGADGEPPDAGMPDMPGPQPDLPGPNPDLPGPQPDMPVPPEAGTDMPVPPEAGTDMPVPPEAGTDMPVPPEAGTDMPVPPEAGGDLPVPPEAGGDLPTPTEAGGDLPTPTEAGGDVTTPSEAGGDSTGPTPDSQPGGDAGPDVGDESDCNCTVSASPTAGLWPLLLALALLRLRRRRS